MEAESIDKTFTPKHVSLTRIATFAVLFSYLALIIYILEAILNIYTKIQLQIGNQVFAEFADLLHTIAPVFTLTVTLGLIAFLLKGVITFLVLQGVAAGLRMIVETDLNYRQKGEER